MSFLGNSDVFCFSRSRINLMIEQRSQYGATVSYVDGGIYNSASADCKGPGINPVRPPNVLMQPRK